MRWWAYATLVVALVVSAIAKPSVTPASLGRSEIVESGTPPTSALQKRSPKHKQVARRNAGDSPLAIVSDEVDPAPPRFTIVEGIEPVDGNTEPSIVLATARAPPT